MVAFLKLWIVHNLTLVMDLANRSNYFIFIETSTFAIMCSHNSGPELRPKKMFWDIEWHNSDIKWKQIWDTENLYESKVFFIRL